MWVTARSSTEPGVSCVSLACGQTQVSCYQPLVHGHDRLDKIALRGVHLVESASLFLGEHGDAWRNQTVGRNFHALNHRSGADENAISQSRR